MNEKIYGIKKDGSVEIECGYPDRGKPKTRKFETGATRDAEEGKYDYEGFLDPVVLERFGKFMTKHRTQTDGSLRESDNWQKGIPLVVYMKSKVRHLVQTWKLHRGHTTFDEKGNEIDLEESLCAELFNTMGYLHELLKEKE